MADSGNPEDLVSKVSVTGTEESGAKLDAYAAQGAQAFDKLDRAAKQSSGSFEKETSRIERAAAEARREIERLGHTRLGSAIAPDLQQIELGAKNLVTAVRSGIPAIASFVARLTAVGAGAAAAGIGLLKLASNVAKGAGTQSSALDQQTESQINANNSALAATQGAIQYESAQRKLFQQLQSGQITNAQYTSSLTQLRKDYNEQILVARQLENAQNRVKEANERLQKQATDKKAFDALIATWGGPMLTALRALGGQADQVFQSFQQAFGPAAASGLDTITKALSTNGTAIGKFFDEAAAKLSSFIGSNGPAIQTAFDNIGAAIKTIFDGIIAALPGLLNFFSNALVPAVKAFGAVLDVIASTINGIFGTQLTGGAIVFLVLLGQMTGAFVAVINVIRFFAAVASIIIGLPFGAVFLAIAAAIGVLLFIFPSLRQVALDVLNSIIETLKSVANGAVESGQRLIAGFTAFVAFIAAIPGQVVGFFTNLWLVITTGVTAFIAGVIAAFQSFIDFVAALPGRIVQFFVDMGTAVVSTVSGWVTQVISFFKNLLTQAKAFLQPILDLLNAIAALSGGGAGGGGTQPVTAAGGGHIRGPGTATSDSIPAWLSDGEFVVKAKSVAKYGAGLMHAINSGQFKMPKFNMGGLVSSMIAPGPRLAYADGGEVAGAKSMRPLNLILGNEEFSGLLAPDDVGIRLTKYAVSRQNKSAGRKPAWFGAGKNS